MSSHVKMVKMLRFASLASATQAAVFRLHVAPHGSDDQLGSSEKPLRSPTAARDVLRRARAEGRVAGRVEVQLETGTYPPLALGPEDSGVSAEAAVVYSAAPGASPVISGGVPVPAAAWVEAETPGVLVAELSAVPGTEDLGSLEPNEAIHECANNKAELIFQQERMFLARYPNVQSDGIWSFLHTDTALNQTCFSIKDAETAERVATWAGEADGWMHGYWQHDWADGYRKIASITEPQGSVWSIELHGSDYTQAGWRQLQLAGNSDDVFTIIAEPSTAEDRCQLDYGLPTTWWLQQNDNLVKRLSCNNQDISIESRSYDKQSLEVCLEQSAKGDGSDPNARFYGVNLLSELDAPGEYFLDRQARRLYFYPPLPLTEWGDDAPVLTMAKVALEMSNTQHVHHEGIAVLHAKGVGINATNVAGAVIRNCTIAGHGLDGIVLVGTNSSIVDSHIHDTGCGGLRAHGGSALTLAAGNLLVSGNTVSHHGLWKRTYMPGIHWAGVANTYSHNTISFGAHNCILGGGNEVREMVPGHEVASVDNIFEYNTFDTCSFESSDTGAFYTCGQQATAWINLGNKLRHSTFKKVRNVGGGGVQSVQVQAVYLDDQMSGWEVYNNSFIDCNVGTFSGGGRLNLFHSNYYEKCDTAHHFDNRGQNWQKGSCDCSHEAAAPFETSCDPAGVAFVLAGPQGSEWAARWPELTELNDACVPVENEVRDNTYRNCGSFTDQSAETYKSWKSILDNNTDLTEMVFV